jgi:hypothetical protein
MAASLCQGAVHAWQGTYPGHDARPPDPDARGLDRLSEDNCTVDGTLIEANASRKSGKKKQDGQQDLPPPPWDDPGDSDGRTTRHSG